MPKKKSAPAPRMMGHLERKSRQGNLLMGGGNVPILSFRVDNNNELRGKNGQLVPARSITKTPQYTRRLKMRGGVLIRSVRMEDRVQ